MDPEGHGIYLGAWLPKSTGLPAQFRTRWTRVAVHLTAALRLRRRLSDNSAGGAQSEAVITPAGRIEHAEGEAKGTDARTALRKAVLDVERSRGARTHNPDRAVAGWKGLVSARWTLVEQFESDGKRYVLARRNDVRVPRDERLTTREEQILGFAVLGHTDKLIAYSMGIAHSTVRVLMHRAARKLSARTRAELLQKYRTRAVKTGDAPL
jgi:DNA-binding CsgD family transcriptional regulator